MRTASKSYLYPARDAYLLPKLLAVLLLAHSLQCLVSVPSDKPKVLAQTHRRPTVGRSHNAQGYQIVEVYRDTEKYGVRGRLVEPHGTRSDRPQFLRMLKEFDDE